MMDPNTIVHITEKGKIVLEVPKRRKLKQVLLLYDDGSIKGYNKTGFLARLKEEIK